VLGPVLFTVSINDIDHDISNKILKFVDDTKVMRNVQNMDEVNKLKSDMSNLFRWSENW